MIPVDVFPEKRQLDCFERPTDVSTKTIGPANIAMDAELASKYKVSDYWRDVDVKNRDGIANAIHRCFLERYLHPISGSSTHGFTKLAVGCLMIEALESFRRGWPDTSKRGHGEHAFCSFFDAHDQFAAFRGHARDFYVGVRCGILHQAETTMGWRIRQDTKSLLEESKSIRIVNAKIFVQALASVLDEYRRELEATEWNADIWACLREKMNTVCRNCEGATAARRLTSRSK
jgi:hypothetical protein